MMPSLRKLSTPRCVNKPPTAAAHVGNRSDECSENAILEKHDAKANKNTAPQGAQDTGADVARTLVHFCSGVARTWRGRVLSPLESSGVIRSRPELLRAEGIVGSLG